MAKNVTPTNPIYGKYLGVIRTAVNGFDYDKPFTVEDLLPDIWGGLSDGEKTAIGRGFSSDVDSRAFRDVYRMPDMQSAIPDMQSEPLDSTEEDGYMYKDVKDVPPMTNPAVYVKRNLSMHLKTLNLNSGSQRE